MYIVIIVIIVILVIGFMLSEKQDQTIKNNKNKVDEKLKNRGFKTSKIRFFSIYGNEQQFRLDLEHKQIAICSIFPYLKIDIINFSDIIECKIIDDSNTVMKGGVGRAVVGGILAGGVGAIVGANTREEKNVSNILQIRIITKNINNSLHTMDLIKTEIERNSTEYKNAMNFANNIYAMIISIINNNDNDKVNNNLRRIKTMEQDNNRNAIEQLERLSKLKSDGMITDKEFEESKQKILTSQNESLDTKTEIIQDESDLSNDIYNVEQKIQLYGNDKIRIIKELRDETGLGLPEAKNIVDEYLKNR